MTDAQIATLEVAGVPDWAVKVITIRFVGKAVAAPDDGRTLTAWRKCLFVAVSGDWNNAEKRPRAPDAPGHVDHVQRGRGEKGHRRRQRQERELHRTAPETGTRQPKPMAKADYAAIAEKARKAVQ